ncbi:cobalamin biosynthesis CobW-like protein [Acetobacterium woodii DSM 1030]|uniref:Cobalamin biosynthesis CobW-like protein n=1 Tax=Acetobacterium woodii (strain ATCC 29683 / DSM 1030 / JCM 2381 / KCTC 1655 / WB1) TaxID=931626 RepID=H6LDA5_ACEWD|nr:cobalamin biosynthesis CobW-like protein [Acetobacterium woodii DSM 1030]
MCEKTKGWEVIILKILILGGFLGSGKTTVLLQLAHYLVEKSQNNKQSRVVIIENEIGQIGIDDKVLRGNGYEVQEIFSGCVCCSLNSDLISGIKDIQKATNPEWVIIEATGVAFPDKIAESLLMNLEIESRIIIIADAQRWKRIRIPLANLIEGQLKDAHLILINKTDLVDEQELTEVEADIYKLNSDAKIARISGIKPVEERILQVIKND